VHNDQVPYTHAVIQQLGSTVTWSCAVLVSFQKMDLGCWVIIWQFMLEKPSDMAPTIHQQKTWNPNAECFFFKCKLHDFTSL